MLQEHGRFKMNPPVRSEEDRQALIEGLRDGTIEMIATDHAPHSAEEKSKGLEKSAFGIVGLETAFPVLYTKLVLTGEISLEKLIELMSINPQRRFNIPMGESYCLWNLAERYTIDPKEFKSMGKATPFEGMEVYGRCYGTVYNGKTVYNR
jgi:dihydroorotase